MYKKNSWGNLAPWYSSMVGEKGTKYHQKQAFPQVLKELKYIGFPKSVLEVGCGTGVFSHHISNKCSYTGIDKSAEMIKIARNKWTNHGDFKVLDITSKNLDTTFDVVIYIFSIQDIDDFKLALKNTRKMLKNGGNLIIFMKHPAFNIPRKSGWSYDSTRKVLSRRIDNYLESQTIPLTTQLGKNVFTTYHYHRSLSAYLNELTKNDLCVKFLKELPDGIKKNTNKNIPLFLLLRAEAV